MSVHWFRAHLHFTWDAAKARANIARHGISFDEAETAFSDANAIFVPNPEHSALGERFVLISFSVAMRVLVVVHCEPDVSGAIC